MKTTEDGYLRLEMDLKNDGNSTLAFRAADCYMDGNWVKAYFLSETYVSDYLFNGGWLTVTRSEGAHRILIYLKPEEESSLIQSFSELSLVFETADYPGFANYQNELDWERFEEVILTRDSTGLNDQDMPELPKEGDKNRYVLDSWDIRPGRLLPEIDIADLLGGAPSTPGDRDQYMHPLSLTLSEEQLENINSAVVSLVLPCGVPDIPDACYLLANFTHLRTEGSKLIADFNGLLAAAAQNDCPFFQFVYQDQKKWHYLAGWLDLQNDNQDTMLLAEHIHLTLDEKETSAFTRQYEAEYHLLEENMPMILSDYLEIYHIPDLEQGIPSHYEQWGYMGMVDDTTSLKKDAPSLVFRPASDWENLYVVFSITDKDGCQWAVSMPYIRNN